MHLGGVPSQVSSERQASVGAPSSSRSAPQKKKAVEPTLRLPSRRKPPSGAPIFGQRRAAKSSLGPMIRRKGGEVTEAAGR